MGGRWERSVSGDRWLHQRLRRPHALARASALEKGYRAALRMRICSHRECVGESISVGV